MIENKFIPCFFLIFDVNTFRITYDYYKKQLDFHEKNLEKLKLLAKEYIIILKNEEIELNTEYIFKSLRKPKRESVSTELKTNYKNMRNAIKLKVKFLNTKVINQSF